MGPGMFQPPPTSAVILFLALAAVAGWAIVEGVLWLVRHIRFDWIS